MFSINIVLPLCHYIYMKVTTSSMLSVLSDQAAMLIQHVRSSNIILFMAGETVHI